MIELLMATLLAAQPDPDAGGGPVVTRVVRTDDGWGLERGGEPFVIRGVGGANQNLDLLASIGGNAIRTWGVGDDTPGFLDDAHAHGIAVCLGVWIPHEGDLTDEAFRAEQVAAARDAAEAFGDHPALLMYTLGNEAEMAFAVDGRTPTEYWTLLEEMAQAVRQVDPDHPIGTVTADLGRSAHAGPLMERAPTVEVWGINSYGGLFTIRQRLAGTGWEGPWMVTEFGPMGQWEVTKTDFDIPIEQTSTEKAAQMALLFRTQLAPPPGVEAPGSDPLGSFAFLWGRKQEASKTWFGLFNEGSDGEGRPVAGVDVLARYWGGSWPDDLAPVTGPVQSEQLNATLAPGETVAASVEAFDPEGAALTYRWELRRAAAGRPNFGRFEPKTDDLTGLLAGQEGASVSFAAPDEPGPYRLFVFIEDETKIATANMLFNVSQ